MLQTIQGNNSYLLPSILLIIKLTKTAIIAAAIITTAWKRMPLMDELRAGLTLNEGSGELEALLCPVVQGHT
jgi:hypothetical protein